MPDYAQLDELGRSSQASQDTCETLIHQIRTTLSEVNTHNDFSHVEIFQCGAKMLQILIGNPIDYRLRKYYVS